MKISSIDAALQGGAGDDGIMPLSGRFSSVLAKYYVQAGHERDDILAKANNSEVAADPARLYALQVQQEAYTKQISLCSALVSHATKGVETLVKT